MTPANIIGMARLKNLDVIAVTDHNSCRNCEAALSLGEENHILVIPGMELTTVEEVHVLCYFFELSDALEFDRYVYKNLIKVENREDLFGRQIVVDQNEKVLYHEPYLLINATTIPFSKVYERMMQFHGVMVPAHLDRNAYSLLGQLGFLPEDSRFTSAEVADTNHIGTILTQYPYLQACHIITNSDAHNLWSIHEADYFLETKEATIESILVTLSSKK